MDERMAERMKDPSVAYDTKLLGDFTDIYCGARHSERPRARLVSDGAAAGVYGKRLPVVCDECAELLRYAEERRALCPKDPKPFCSACDTHCYRPAMRSQMQEVMRFAGPRSWRRGYLIEGVKHAVQTRKAKRSQQRHPAGGADNQEEPS